MTRHQGGIEEAAKAAVRLATEERWRSMFPKATGMRFEWVERLGQRPLLVRVHVGGRFTIGVERDDRYLELTCIDRTRPGPRA